MTVRIFHRALLADLPAWEERGYRAAVVSPCGAVGAEPFCWWTLATVLIERSPEPFAGARLDASRWEAA